MRSAFRRLVTCGELPPEGDGLSSDDEGPGGGTEGEEDGWGLDGGGGGRARGGGDKLRQDERRKHAIVQE
jgi:hypothetical protein